MSVHVHNGISSVYTNKRDCAVQFLQGKIGNSGRGRTRNGDDILTACTERTVFSLLQAREPKAVIDLADLNVAFCPDKVGNPNGMQLYFELKGSELRNIFVYTDKGKVGAVM